MHRIQDVSKPPDITPYRDRFGKDYEGPSIPFGAAIRYKPSSKAGLALLPKFGDKLLPGIFIGYDTRSGGSWTGNLFVADKSDLETATVPSLVPIRTLKSDEIFPLLMDGKFHFPVADGSCKPPDYQEEEWSSERREQRGFTAMNLHHQTILI